MVDFFCLTWYVQDGFRRGSRVCHVHCFGKTHDNVQVHITVPFQPFFYALGRKDGEFANNLRDAMAHAGVDPCDLLLHQCSVESKYSFLGFTNQKKTVTKLRFLTKKAFTFAKKFLAPHETLFESNVDVDLQFLHENGLKSVGWLRVDSEEHKLMGDRLHVYCSSSQLHNHDPRADLSSPCVLASYDIEAFSDSNSFPQPEKQQDVLFMVATTFQLLGSEKPFEQHLVVLDDCGAHLDDNESLTVEKARDERHLIELWAARLLKNGTDVLIAYNNFGFDDRYLDTRYKLGFRNSPPWESGIPLSRMFRGTAPERAWIKQQRSEFAGFADSKILVTPGIWNLDLLVVMKQQHQLEAYSLDFVSEKFLQDHKIDLPAKQMFRMYAEGRRGQKPELIAEIGRYCLKDTVLPLRLIQKLNIVPSMIEMAAANTVPLDFLLQRGQSVRCFSMVTKKMHDYDIICPSVMYDAGGDYEGATVIEPTKGAYWGPIAVLDYASLYPSIIRSNMLCPSRLVVDPAFSNIPGVAYLDVPVSEQVYRYAVSFSDKLPPAVLPVLLEELAALRKKAKACMESATDPWQKTLFDAKQKAIKVSMNSVYGVFGAARGFLTCQPLAASVTAIGRQMINTTKEMIEEAFPGTRVVYGDSVAEYTPILVKVSNLPQVVAIADIAEIFGGGWVHRDDNKEVSRIRGVQVWSEQGWTPIIQVIRHALAPSKDMWRVMTHTGVVDVTSDHSLLLADGKEARPIDLRVGQRLLHAPYRPSKRTQQLRQCTAYIDQKNQISAAKFFLEARSSGYTHVVIGDDHNLLSLTASNEPQGKCATSINKMYALPRPSKPVYDLTTENSHFQAGVGDLIVHNTDSVMIKFPLDNMTDAFQRGAKAAEMMTNHFKPPVKLELEKVFNPYLLFAKKQYAGLQYSGPDTDPVLNIKGLGVVRRDSCRFVREASLRVLNSLLYDRDVEGAKKLALSDAEALLSHRVDPQLLYLSRKLNAEYKEKSKSLAQVRIRDKMQQRVSEGNSQTAPPQPGDRIKFVYANLTKSKRSTAGEKAEDPLWLMEQYPRDWKTKIDVEYYFTNCFSNPVLSYLILVDSGSENLFQEVYRRYKLKRDRQKEITSFFQKRIKD